jgi:uncharacterized protein YbjT (DUF2867 family)
MSNSSADDRHVALLSHLARLLFNREFSIRVSSASQVSRRENQTEKTMLLLTGAAGSAGSFIVEEFVRQKTPLRILVRDRKQASQFEGVPTIDIVVGDMSRKDSLGPALHDVVRVLMISSSVMDMVETQCKFADACRAAGIEHLIKFSGLDARRETRFPFGLMHKQIEGYIEHSGLVWTHLRPSGFMQEYLREVPSIVNNAAIFLPLAETRLNPVDLADVAKVAYLLLRDGGHKHQRLAMTGPEALTMSEIAACISKAAGKKVQYIAITPAERRQALLAHGIPPQFVDALALQVEERLKGGKESEVDQSTHRKFNVEPTTFLDFALRNAPAFGGTAVAQKLTA